MATVPLPAPLDQIPMEKVQPFGQRLHDEFKIEVPLMPFAGRQHIRPCFQIYNTAADVRRLGEVIQSLKSSFQV
jgi:selenocysteine lyase/cysteine desulfurase